MLLIFALVITRSSENFFISIVRAFAFQIMCFYFLIAAFWLLKKRWRLTVVGVACALMIKTILPPVFNYEVSIETPRGFKIAHFNVLQFNSDYENTIRVAISSNADFISFQEVNQKWADSLQKGLSECYPYSKVISQESCCYGLAVYSKYPLHNVKEIYIENLPNIAGNIELEDTTLHFIASHTKAPISPARHRRRNRHIRELAGYLDSIPAPKIALGDYNAVPWDSVMKEFKNSTQLSDSRKTLMPTYPASFAIAMIPIDYIFHSRDLSCVDFTTIGGTSSDHLGIFGVYKFNETAQ